MHNGNKTRLNFTNTRSIVSSRQREESLYIRSYHRLYKRLLWLQVKKIREKNKNNRWIDEHNKNNFRFPIRLLYCYVLCWKYLKFAQSFRYWGFDLFKKVFENLNLDSLLKFMIKLSKLEIIQPLIVHGHYYMEMCNIKILLNINKPHLKWVLLIKSTTLWKKTSKNSDNSQEDILAKTQYF